MADTLHVGRRELSSAEIYRELERGNRIVIQSSLLGKKLRLVIREQSGTYYCDTPVKLFTFDNEDELLECLERYRLSRPETAVEAHEQGAESD